jgi:hypothetical protein
VLSRATGSYPVGINLFALTESVLSTVSGWQCYSLLVPGAYSGVVSIGALRSDVEHFNPMDISSEMKVSEVHVNVFLRVEKLFLFTEVLWDFEALVDRVISLDPEALRNLNSGAHHNRNIGKNKESSGTSSLFQVEKVGKISKEVYQS